MNTQTATTREFLAAIMEEETDPHDAAARALAEANEDQFQEFAYEGAAYMARRLIHDRRRQSHPAPARQGGHASHFSTASGGWAEASQATWDLTIPYLTPDGWKKFGDCSVEDLDAIASGYRELEASNAAQAARFESLAERMRSQGIKYVKDLGGME